MNLSLLVFQGDSPSACGRDWLGHLQVDWRAVHHISQAVDHNLEELLTQYDVFRKELGGFRGSNVKIHVDQQATPRFHKARTVPYLLPETPKVPTFKDEENAQLET